MPRSELRRTLCLRGRSAAALAVLVSTLSAPAAAGVPCPGQGISVTGGDALDTADACAAARDAGRVLASLGLAMPAPVTVRLVPAGPASGLADHEVGHYDAARNEVRVLTHAAAVARCRHVEPGLGAITTRPRWRSYVVHELAHAAIHQGRGQSRPSRAGHEYVAAVAQLASMPEPLRNELLARYDDLPAFGEDVEITEIYYAMNPHYFAVKAYKHFRQQPDPAAEVRRRLDAAGP